MSKKEIAYNSPLRCGRELRGHFGKIYCLFSQVYSAKERNKKKKKKKRTCAYTNTNTNTNKIHNLKKKKKIWNSKTGLKRQVISVEHNSVMAVDFSPDGSLLAGGGLDNVCSIFHKDDYSSAKCELLEHQGYVSQCRFMSNYEIITSSGDSSCLLWDIETRSVKSRFRAHKADVIGIDNMNETINTKHHSLVLTGSIDKTVKLWDIRVSKKISSETDHTGSTPFGCGTDHCVMTFYGHENDVNAVKWFPSYNFTFASASVDGTVRLWDLRSMGQLNLYDYGNHVEKSNALPTPPAVTSITFSKSGYFLFAAYDDYPHCVAWNTMSALPHSILEHNDAISSLAMTKDGFALVTAGWDMTGRIWA
ncbi:hypothetical protein RFI_11879 [Reticulomyxa filosa]|uniref:Uncharacterized protein n=1 Tax=Reticulomyxa filosa TaxID=46433 RepID=X6NIT4_RETFI|nr:hypothetical protein RFI_11879 [Reticulomyxa filosa]|eukprot:ETO25262.1 hypothetical protein RFI_11879 [Reticulomyxa filosa]